MTAPETTPNQDPARPPSLDGTEAQAGDPLLGKAKKGALQDVKVTASCSQLGGQGTMSTLTTHLTIGTSQSSWVRVGGNADLKPGKVTLNLEKTKRAPTDGEEMAPL